ncbi:MAG TPA: hypothetical protein VKA41_06590 [Solirubrobacterales bacterium]|nr:hypothetical protein [Solirubrobacterales bacterium]
MRWLKHTLSLLLVLAAAAVVAATLFSDHSDDYGRVSLPQGGNVHLPEGKVTVFYALTEDPSDLTENTAGLAFQVIPAGGGEPVAITGANGQASDTAVTRSETIGELGAIVKLDVPAAGDYVVRGSTNLAPGASYLEFGTNAGSALLERWKLIAGLLLGALLIALIPVPRSGRRWGDAPDAAGWSSDPRAPYAG